MNHYYVTNLKSHVTHQVLASNHLSAVQGVVIMHLDRRAIIFRLSGEPDGPGKFQAYIGTKPIGPEYYVE